MASEKRVRERIPESYEMTSEECSAMFELEELDNQLPTQKTPAQVLWYGCGRKILFVSVQVSEQTAEGEWRLMRELKPFRTHVRHEGPVGKLIAKARQKYGMKYDDWKIAEVEYDTERFVCQFASPHFHPRRIEFVLKRCEPMLGKRLGRHYGALINRAIRENGIAVLKNDEQVKKMRHELLFNCWKLRQSGFREKCGKKICRFRALPPA